MKKIKLTQGQVALVSDHRYEELSQWRWWALWSPNGQTYYAVRTVHIPTAKGEKPKTRKVYMHRHIMGDPKGMNVDHKNHDTLNNTDENLRIATYSESSMNRRIHKSNRLGVRNISTTTMRKKYKGKTYVYCYFRVQVAAYGQVWFKLFKSLDDAIAARDLKLKELHGEYACGRGCV